MLQALQQRHATFSPDLGPDAMLRQKLPAVGPHFLGRQALRGLLQRCVLESDRLHDKLHGGCCGLNSLFA
jgi:hypothetical protein